MQRKVSNDRRRCPSVVHTVLGSLSKECLGEATEFFSSKLKAIRAIKWMSVLPWFLFKEQTFWRRYGGHFECHIISNIMEYLLLT